MSDFGVTPTWVYPVETKYNVITTEADNFKKEYYLLSATPNRQFRLVFTGLTDVSFATVLTHWSSVSGPYGLFNWNSVPSYIDGGSGLGVTMQGRWLPNPKFEPQSKSWDVELVFEKDI